MQTVAFTSMWHLILLSAFISTAVCSLCPRPEMCSKVIWVQDQRCVPKFQVSCGQVYRKQGEANVTTIDKCIDCTDQI